MRPIFSLIYIPLRKPRIERGRFELSRKSIRDVEVVPSLQRRSSRWKSKRCGKEEEENEEAGDGEDQGGPPLQVQQPHHTKNCLKVNRKPGGPRWPASPSPTPTSSPQQAGHMLVRKGQTQHRNRGRFCETTLDEHCTSTPSLAFSTSAVKGCSALTLNR